VSFSVDVNLLLYASDTASPHHEKAASFLDRCLAETEVMCVAWPTIMGYLRIVTHPAIFANPLRPDEAKRNVEAILRAPHVRVIGEADGFWRVFDDVSRQPVARGNLVPDAHFAAILKLHGVRTLYTNDRDFRRYDFLEVRDPR
jgi:toxin-antitoxin system PIN domain toxin